MDKSCATNISTNHPARQANCGAGNSYLPRNKPLAAKRSYALIAICALLTITATLLTTSCNALGENIQPTNTIAEPDSITEEIAPPVEIETTSPPTASEAPQPPPMELPRFEIPVSVASGINTEENESAIIDYSNSSEGYVMAKFLGETTTNLRVMIETPTGNNYVYVLTQGKFEVFPFTEGDGTYIVGIYEQIEGSRFRVVLIAHIDVALSDPLLPFLRPSQLVDFNKDSEVVHKAHELVTEAVSFLDKISKVFNFIIEHIEYDFELAQTVEFGYVPILDEVLYRGKGICYDYAAVMTAMLRSQGIPTQMVHGYTGEVYHAWINVYSEEEGWINNIIFFDGENWILMDPTFASVGGDEAAIEFIGDGSNYVSMFYF